MLDSWMYVSRATTPMGSLDDVLIYLAARARNREKGITGYLHREQDYYVQYIEGEHENLAELRSLITKDTRHTDLRVLSQGAQSRRLFDGWDMAFSTGAGTGFAEYRTHQGYRADLTSAAEAEILEFMKASIAGGRAHCVALYLPEVAGRAI